MAEKKKTLQDLIREKEEAKKRGLKQRLVEDTYLGGVKAIKDKITPSPSPSPSPTPSPTPSPSPAASPSPSPSPSASPSVSPIRTQSGDRAKASDARAAREQKIKEGKILDNIEIAKKMSESVADAAAREAERRKKLAEERAEKEKKARLQKAAMEKK